MQDDTTKAESVYHPEKPEAERFSRDTGWMESLHIVFQPSEKKPDVKINAQSWNGKAGTLLSVIPLGHEIQQIYRTEGILSVTVRPLIEADRDTIA